MEKGRGEREIYIEKSLADELEKAWKDGRAIVRLNDGQFNWEYNLLEMTQSWFEPQGTRHSKPVYRKVNTGIVQ